uniref:Uncharacterized protein n=1 Tax=Oryza brachyantha TaxID=4533 RepID=J3L6K3_ORYBR
MALRQGGRHGRQVDELMSRNPDVSSGWCSAVLKYLKYEDTHEWVKVEGVGWQEHRMLLLLATVWAGVLFGSCEMGGGGPPLRLSRDGKTEGNFTRASVESMKQIYIQVQDKGWYRQYRGVGQHQDDNVLSKNPMIRSKYDLCKRKQPILKIGLHGPPVLGGDITIFPNEVDVVTVCKPASIPVIDYYTKKGIVTNLHAEKPPKKVIVELQKTMSCSAYSPA